MEQERCGDCKYYQVSPLNLKEGFCRVNPPVVIALPGPKGIVINGFDAPIGNNRFACEKFKPKAILTN